jgi:hypothetical protein
MLRLLARFACPRRALQWGNVAPGRNHPLTRSLTLPPLPVIYAVAFRGHVVETIRPSPPWPCLWLEPVDG